MADDVDGTEWDEDDIEMARWLDARMPEWAKPEHLGRLLDEVLNR